MDERRTQFKLYHVAYLSNIDHIVVIEQMPVKGRHGRRLESYHCSIGFLTGLLFVLLCAKAFYKVEGDDNSNHTHGEVDHKDLLL